MAEAESVEKAGRLWGKSLRRMTPRRSHAAWSSTVAPRDPVTIITDQNTDRVQWLVPIRHWRMSETPFTFYRGAAALMSHDLAVTPNTGITAQICGDAHLANFGVFASPERALVFDLNDFDETLPGPWEWDVKRMATSFTIAARNNEYGSKYEKSLAKASVTAYRTAMSDFAGMRYLDAWYSRFHMKDIERIFGEELTKKERKGGRKFARKARSKDSVHAQHKLAEEIDGRYRIVNQAPLIVPIRDMPDDEELSELVAEIEQAFDDYLVSLPDYVYPLTQRFKFTDIALKVVGVGSVGTRCFIVLFEGLDSSDPFFLQIKEATQSVLAAYLPDSVYEDQGERVVVGQQMMQASSDSFLGWTTNPVKGRHYYWRQFKDMKGSLDIENASTKTMLRYAKVCGWTLARAHARSADSAAIAGYLGKGDVFDDSIAEFGIEYADQNERDYTAFMAAIDSGRIEAHG